MADEEPDRLTWIIWLLVAAGAVTIGIWLFVRWQQGLAIASYLSDL